MYHNASSLYLIYAEKSRVRYKLLKPRWNLVRTKSPWVVIEVDPLRERGMDGAFERLFELGVTDQHDLEYFVLIERGADQQAKIEQGLDVEQRGFIDEQQRGGLERINVVDDLQQDWVFVRVWLLPQSAGEPPQEGDRGEAGEVKIDRLHAVLFDRPDKQANEHRLADPFFTGDQCEVGCVMVIWTMTVSLARRTWSTSGRRRPRCRSGTSSLTLSRYKGTSKVLLHDLPGAVGL